MGLQPERIEALGPFTIAGMDRRYGYGDRGGLAGQWSEAAPMPAASADRVAYGVSYGMDAEGFRYICGVRVDRQQPLPAGLVVVCLPPQCYAVFVHRDHVSRLRQTCEGACQWLAGSAHRMGGHPVMVERYGEQFCAATGLGEVEIWLSIEGPVSPEK